MLKNPLWHPFLLLFCASKLIKTLNLTSFSKNRPLSIFMKGAKWLQPLISADPTFRLLDRIPLKRNRLLSAQEESQFPLKNARNFEKISKNFSKFFRKIEKKRKNLPLYAPIFRQLCLKNTKKRKIRRNFPLKRVSP